VSISGQPSHNQGHDNGPNEPLDCRYPPSTLSHRRVRRRLHHRRCV
jgi:hypothetical protein